MCSDEPLCAKVVLPARQPKRMYVVGLSALYLKWIFFLLVCAENEKYILFAVICDICNSICALGMVVHTIHTYTITVVWYGTIPYHTMVLGL